MPRRRRAASTGAEDRCSSMPARSQLQPDEQQRLDVDEGARDPLNRPAGGGGGGAGPEVEEAVPDRTGEDAATRTVVQPSEHDRAAGQAKDAADVSGRSEIAVGGKGEEEGQVPDGPDRGDEQRGGESSVATLQHRQREPAQPGSFPKGIRIAVTQTGTAPN